MQMIADILLGAGALGAAFYCLVLSRRLKRFTRLENGMGSAIAVLSSQVDQMTRVLEAAQAAARNSADTLEAKTARGEKVAERLELILAAMHDLPTGDDATKVQAKRASKAGKRTSATPAADPNNGGSAEREDGLASLDGPGSAEGIGILGSEAPGARARFVRRRNGRKESEAA